MEKARGVETANESSARIVVFAVSGLVAEAPHDDAGMISVAFDHTANSFQPGRAVRRVVTQRCVEGMALDVRLVHDVQAELVTQVVETVVVRIVRCAHGVDVVPLHREQIGAHSLDRDRLTTIRIVIVTIHAHHRDRGTVD